MDRGGIFCLHDSFCYYLPFCARLCHAPHAHSLCGAVESGKATQDESRLGVAAPHVAFHAHSRDCE